MIKFGIGLPGPFVWTPRRTSPRRARKPSGGGVFALLVVITLIILLIHVL